MRAGSLVICPGLFFCLSFLLARAAGGELPVLQLPEDLVRPAVKSYRGSRVSVSLSLSDSVAPFCAAGVRLYAFHGLSGFCQRSFLPLQRSDRPGHRSPLLGVRACRSFPVSWVFYANTLAFFRTVYGEEDFLGFCRMFRSVCLGGMLHQLYTFERLVRNRRCPVTWGGTRCSMSLLSVQEDSAICPGGCLCGRC
ncbi:hypothetical protein OHD16_27235 [Sphingobacterium sp. ML3W]|uniref:hypothetical protein n=1 Tax=Sphingobacterium sp. ML3W TaxID=1538644 RepID=UPI003009A581